MKQKTIKINYWIFTTLFALFMLFSGVSSFMPPTEQGLAVMALLGYPLYLNFILGTAKILGVVAILQNKFKTIKEWAYAGFTFDMLGAASSFALSGVPIQSLFVLPFVVLMFVSYYFWKKI
jgi:hypothetical protein